MFIKTQKVNFVNRPEYDLLLEISKEGFGTQRKLADETGLSLGLVNKSLSFLIQEGYVDNNQITDKTRKLLNERKPKNAIILAAGFGMRMVPINNIAPKGLIKVKNEVLIERIIRQLKEARINNITIVTGFMKESFEYLIDDFGVKLIVNTHYNIKNNLHSLKLAADKIDNTYIIPSDI